MLCRYIHARPGRHHLLSWVWPHAPSLPTFSPVKTGKALAWDHWRLFFGWRLPKAFEGNATVRAGVAITTANSLKVPSSRAWSGLREWARTERKGQVGVGLCSLEVSGGHVGERLRPSPAGVNIRASLSSAHERDGQGPIRLSRDPWGANDSTCEQMYMVATLGVWKHRGRLSHVRLH